MVNKTLAKIIEVTNKIDQTSSKTIKDYEESLARAEADLEKVIHKKETADTEAELEAAVKEEILIREKIPFYRRKLEAIKFSSRVTDKEYKAVIDSVKKEMEKAAAEYRKEAVAAMDSIMAAQEKYMALAHEADTVLGEYDNASNYLQVKYRYRPVVRVGMDTEYQEDPAEWHKHVTRFDSIIDRRAHSMATGGEDPDSIKAGVAWAAASRLQRRF